MDIELTAPEDYLVVLEGFVERIDQIGPRTMVAMMDEAQLEGFGDVIQVAVHLVKLKQHIVAVKEKIEVQGVAFEYFEATKERIEETPAVLDLLDNALTVAGY